MAAVRLGGLYSLERLARDYEQHRQTVVDVVCAYLRMPIQSHMTESNIGADATTNMEQEPDGPAGNGADQELQVRLAAQRLLARHLRAPMSTSNSASRESDAYWHSVRIDLSGARLIHPDFSGCTFSSADFSGARFSGGRVRFSSCRFPMGALFSSCVFDQGADFSRSVFGGGASFTGCSFMGQADYSGALFQNAGFNRARFEREVFFGASMFSGTTWFRRAEFSENSEFREVTFGAHVVFDYSSFRGNADFTRASFLRSAQFREVDFARRVQFMNASFTESATFKGAKFRHSPRFIEAKFGSTVDFRRAQFESRPNFTRAIARAPNTMHEWPPSWQIDPVTNDGECGRLISTYDPYLLSSQYPTTRAERTTHATGRQQNRSYSGDRGADTN